MSIFTSEYNPTAWLQQKSLMLLEVTTELVDIANAPDTTVWYAKNLKRIAANLLSMLIPMTALFYGLGEDPVKREEWIDIAEKGTFALTRWCRKWGVANPYHLVESVIAKTSSPEEYEEKREKIAPEVKTVKDEGAQELKLLIFGRMAICMLDDDLGRTAQKLLAWALFHLETSEYADVVVLNKAFLPTDIGCTAEETSEGYRRLYQRGLIEKVDGIDLLSESIAIRLVVNGVNDNKHAPVFEEESFGRKGIRIGGVATTGNMIPVFFRGQQRKYMEWLKASPEKFIQIKDHLQATMGEDRVFVEDVQISLEVGQRDESTLDVMVRYPLNFDDAAMEKEIGSLVRDWIKAVFTNR